MTPLAPTLQAFFTDRLHRPTPRQPEHDRRLPRHLPAAAAFATEAPARRQRARHHRPRRAPDRRVPRPPRDRTGQHDRTRNNRLAAIHSLFTYPALRHPEHADRSPGCSRSPPSADRTLSPTSPPEVNALLAARDQTTWTGRRDHALLLLAAQTGLRISELIALTCGDIVARHRRPRAHHRQRTQSSDARRCCRPSRSCSVWLAEREPAPPTRCSPRTGRRSAATRSSTVSPSPRAAAQRLPVVAGQARHHAHALRHTAAMTCCWPATTSP